MATWIKVIEAENIPLMGSRKVIIGEEEIALFKTRDGSIFAINNICPHKQGKLTEGLVHEHMVSCPLHNTDINLATGEAVGEDYGCTNTYMSKIEDNFVYLQM